MPTIATVDSRQATGDSQESWNSNSTQKTQATASSSSSASSKLKYGLTDNGDKVLVYNHDANGTDSWVKIMTDTDLCRFLDEHDGDLRCGKKQIGRGERVVPVYGIDRLNEPSRTMYSDKPNPWIADVTVPSRAYFGRLLTDKYSELHILSKILSKKNHKTLLDIPGYYHSVEGERTCESPTAYL